MRLILTTLPLLLITVAICNGAENVKTTLAPKNDATSKTAPIKEIATAKSINGKEDEAKNVKKGDLGKDKTAAKNDSSEESPSEDAQEDLGVDENHGPTIPAYQIPEQPKDVKKKKRWVGNPDIDFAIDNALGAIFGRPQLPPPPPADTVIEEVTYVDEYPSGPVVYKRSKGTPPSEAEKLKPPPSEAENLKPSKEMADIPIDSVDTVSLKGDPIAISKPEIEAAPKAPIISGKNAQQKAMPKMEVGNLVTILPAIDEEKDFGSSAENAEEMKYSRIAPEVAGLIKKSIPVSEKNETQTDEEIPGGEVMGNGDEETSEADKVDKASEAEKASEENKEEVQENEMKEKNDTIEKIEDKKGEKEFVPVYAEDDKESEADEAAEKPQKDDSKAFEMEKEEESEAQKDDTEAPEESKAKNSDDAESDSKVEEEKAESKSKDAALKISEENEKSEGKEEKVVPEGKPRHREPEELPINPKENDDEEEKASEELPLVDHESKKLPEEEKDDASEKSEENESEAQAVENKDDSEAANIEKDEYAPSDDKIKEDKAKIDAINPASPEITKSEESKKPEKAKNDDDKLGPAPYASEISDDDFSIDHKTGLMPAVSSNNNDDDEIPVASENEKDNNYNVLQKLQDDVDAASKKDDQNPDYIVMEELKDPINGHRKFTILKPNYRAFHPTDNKLIEEVKATLEKSKVAKRSIRSLEKSESEEEEDFESSFSKDTVIESDSNEILKNVADAIEKDGLRKPKKDQQPMFIPDDYPIPLKKVGKPSLNEILGIPESAGPVMIEPEGGIPKGLKQIRSDETEYSNPDYDAPQKVVIQSKQKITLVYDDNSSEEATKDSSSESSSSEEEEEKSQPWIPIMGIATIINDQKPLKSKQPKIEDPDQQPPPTSLPLKHSDDQESYEEKLKKYSNILGNNLVITLSISPSILIIAGVICLTLLLFKVYWVLYSPPSQPTSIIPQHSSAATTPNMDFRTPLSIVTVTDPKKQPL